MCEEKIFEQKFSEDKALARLKDHMEVKLSVALRAILLDLNPVGIAELTELPIETVEGIEFAVHKLIQKIKDEHK